MGRAPCCDKANVKKGPWSPEEDAKLKEFIDRFGTGGNWIALPQKAGLRRCGKSCRLRWLNYLRPNIKHGEFSDEEDRMICTLYASIGSRWSIIAAQLPGRTDNDIKNYWNTKLKKKLMGLNISPNNLTPQISRTNLESQLSNQPLSRVSQVYTDHNSYNSFYFQTPKSPSLTPFNDQSNTVSAPQNLNFMSSTFDNFSLSTPQYFYYFGQNQEGVNSVGFQYSTGKLHNNNNNIFGGNNETSCTSSSDGSCSQVSYGAKDYYHRYQVKQEDQQTVGCNINFQGFLSGNYEKLLLNHGDPVNAAAFVDEKISGINSVLPNSELECDLEEVKQLVSTGTNYGSSNNCNSLFFNYDDENKTHEEKGMYYYNY